MTFEQASVTGVLLGALALAGCEGSDGPPGPDGPAGPEGAERATGADGAAGADNNQTIFMREVGRYFVAGTFGEGAAEITAFDPSSDRVFVVNALAATVDVLDLAVPAAPSLLGTLDASALGDQANSVAVSDGVVAVAIERRNPDDESQQNGLVAFYDAASSDLLATVDVGPLPDMLTFTPDGSTLLVANEGEPNAELTVNPPGSVSIIDVSGGAGEAVQEDVRTADFSPFNVGGAKEASFDPRIRNIFAGATRAEEVEPEYIAVSPDGATAWVTLQEHNAVAILDVASAEFVSVVYFGEKDHRIPGNELDASNEDGGVNISTWPVFGLYQPDAVAAFEAASGQTYLVTANEGDAVDYDGFSEQVRIADLVLDPVAFPDAATLQAEENLGRLQTTLTLGEIDVTKLYGYGGRSFSIWTDRGALVYDSGNDFETLTAVRLGGDFNASNDANGGDDRSDDKGPEPEGVTVGRIGSRHYAFIGLERIGGIMVYDITQPESPRFVQYVSNRLLQADQTDLEAGLAGDLGPEGLTFVAADQSPSGAPLLIVGNEITGSTTIYEILVSP
jgi:2',3'-cyclic-nucleotide 2'-phosphodiesterase / 3'-nucleotidase / 5'-nucleotidase